MGSPSSVPVPCASMYPSASGVMDASSQAFISMLDCAPGWGAVIPWECPSWFAVVASSTPYILSPSAIAFSNGFNRTTPHPSAFAIPLALASNARHLAFGDVIPSWFHISVFRLIGKRSRVIPPAMAISQSPDSSP
ncbi:hypothetical protein DPMN_087946 [Dreissena polymorpha]|uniref:Uncharacterized protein n=1 Tax=Dreissena polymorpha TaxID=45954 RepID=A0A9D4KTY0_DREPO|nr:hypothetical protein DPMN_087946 [Dreissena polymorpha]